MNPRRFTEILSNFVGMECAWGEGDEGLENINGVSNWPAGCQLLELLSLTSVSGVFGVVSGVT